MIVKWICAKCGLLNDMNKSECKNCEDLKLMNIGIVHFNDVEHMKSWIKQARDYMGAKVWWSP